MTTLDAKTLAAIERWVDEAPPLTEKQKDAIAAAFRGAIAQPQTGVMKPESPRREPGAKHPARDGNDGTATRRQSSGDARQAS